MWNHVHSCIFLYLPGLGSLSIPQSLKHQTALQTSCAAITLPQTFSPETIVAVRRLTKISNWSFSKVCSQFWNNIWQVTGSQRLWTSELFYSSYGNDHLMTQHQMQLNPSSTCQEIRQVPRDALQTRHWCKLMRNVWICKCLLQVLRMFGKVCVSIFWGPRRSRTHAHWAQPTSQTHLELQ